MPVEKIEKSEKKIDRELKDTFPASDPPSGNVFVGAPTERECAHCEDHKKAAEKK